MNAASVFHIAVGDEGDRTVVTVHGDIDIATAPWLRDCLNEVIAAGRRNLTIDVAGVGFLDSTGIGTLVSALKRTREAGGALWLRAPSVPVQRKIEIAGLAHVLPVEDR